MPGHEWRAIAHAGAHVIFSSGEQLLLSLIFDTCFLGEQLSHERQLLRLRLHYDFSVFLSLIKNYIR